MGAGLQGLKAAETPMAKVEIYTMPACGFCIRAKRLLDEKHTDYVEYDVYKDREKYEEVRDELPAPTLPQIVIDGDPIGGCDELYALDRRGILDGLLT